MFDNILSTFDPPAENPLYEGGNWAQTFNQPPLQKVLVFGGDAVATDSAHGAVNYSHWTQDQFRRGDVPIEAFACTEGGQLGAALETWRVALWNTVTQETPEGHVGSVTGYLVYFGGAIGKGFAIRRYDTTGFTQIGASGAVGFPEMIGIRIIGAVIEAWGMYGGVWSLMATATDSNHQGWFYPGIGIEDPTGGGLSIPCFGAGIESDPEFIRWLRV